MSMRGGRSDWAEYVRRKQREPTQADNKRLKAWYALAAGTATDDDRARLAADERAEPVQHESPEIIRLGDGIATRWYWPGYRRFEHAVAIAMSPQTKNRRKRERIRGGWPDCGLLIPKRTARGLSRKVGAMGDLNIYGPTVAYCEMKAPDRRPRRAVADQWWLEPEQVGTRYGLTREQGAVLRMLDAMGASTMVAFSADEALAWFDSLAGPRPEVMPECWRYWLEPEL